MQPLYSWTDTYLALTDAFGAARGWLDDIIAGERVRRCPATTNADVIMLAAIFEDALRNARGAYGREAMLSKWVVCSTNIERSALPPADPRAVYHHNKTLWLCFKEGCLYLEHDGAPPPSRATWDAIRAQIADPIDHSIARNRRNRWQDVKITEGKDGRATFEGWADYNELHLAQWDYFKRKRGVDQGTRVPIPRTTNQDVLQLATFWMDALSSHEDVGDRPGMKNWDALMAEWNTAVMHVQLEAIGHDPHAVYAHNEELWEAMDDLSSLVVAGQHAPTRWDLFTRALEHSITHLPQNLYKGVKAIGSGAESAIESVADTAGKAGGSLLGGLLDGLSALKWPLMIGGGALGVYLVTRSGERAPVKEAA